MSGWAEKQATSMASTFLAIEPFSAEARARMHASEERMASVADSIADGAGCGAVKPYTKQVGGKEDLRVERQASVMLRVEFGLMSRMETFGCALPWMGAVKGDEEVMAFGLTAD